MTEITTTDLLEIVTYKAQLVEVPTTESSREVFRILGFTEEWIHGLSSLEFEVIHHSTKATDYIATFRYGKDSGQTAATWTVIGDKTHFEAIYALSEDEMEDEFGPGDYSCSVHTCMVLSWDGPTNVNNKLCDKMPKLNDILELL
jgi:hypothetical protein